MQLSTKALLRSVIFFALAISVCCATASRANAQQEMEPASSGLAKLLMGNARYVSGVMQPKNYGPERLQLLTEQHPYAIVLACADSRVPPEILFDESLGKLFVVRVAGEVIDPVSLGSIEYAVEHLHVNLLIVLGHDGCGAVRATLSGGDMPPNIAALLARIKPAVDKVVSLNLEEKQRLPEAIKENVRFQMQKSIYDSEVIQEYVRSRRLTIVGGVYHLDSGKVEMMATELAFEIGTGASESPRAVVAMAKPEAQQAAAEAAKPRIPSEASKPIIAAEEKRERSEPAKTVPAAPPMNRTFSSMLQQAYDNKEVLIMRKTMLMRDEHDRCLRQDCKSISAGEQVSLENPLVLSILGRPHLRVRYKGQPLYILADPEAIALVAER